MRICWIDLKTGLVSNVSMMAAPEDLPKNCSQPQTPPDGFLWVASDEAQIGWAYANGAFIVPELPAPPSLPPSPIKQLADMLAAKNLITAQDAATFNQDAVPTPKAGG